MSYDISYHFGASERLDKDQWQSFLRRCVQIKGFSIIKEISPFCPSKSPNAFSGYICGIRRAKEFTTADSEEPLVGLEMEATGEMYGNPLDIQLRRFRRVLTFRNVGGGFGEYWGAFFTVPVVAWHSFGGGAIVISAMCRDRDHAFWTLDSYLTACAKQLAEIIGHDDLSKENVVANDRFIYASFISNSEIEG